MISKNTGKETSQEFIRKFASVMKNLDYRTCERDFSDSQSYVPSELSTCDKIWVRVDRLRKPLEAPYCGPFEVLKRSKKTFTILRPNQTQETISIDRCKPYRSSSNSKNLPKFNPKSEEFQNEERIIPKSSRERRIRFNIKNDYFYY